MSATTSGPAHPRRPREGGFAVQFRVVGALMHRDMLSRFGRTLIGYPWEVLSPLLMVALMSALFTVLQRRAPIGESFVLFFATGYMPYLVFRQTSSRGFGVFSSSGGLFAFPMIKPIDLMLSHLLLEYWTMVVATVICFILIWIAGFGAIPDDMLTLMGALGLLGLLCFGLGVFNACIETFFSSWPRFYRLVVMALFYTSGIFYVPDWLPEQLRAVVVWNPMLHVIELFRMSFYAGYGSQTFDERYLMGWAFGLLPLSLALERVVRMSRQA